MFSYGYVDMIESQEVCPDTMLKLKANRSVDTVEQRKTIVNKINEKK